jgi:hypothetical protein
MTAEQLAEILKKHIPEIAAFSVAEMLLLHKVHLTIKWTRQTKLGDYRVPRKGEQHRITINNSLNKFAFLITLIHELAHLTTFQKYGNRVASHGIEWKNEFKILMQPYLFHQPIFPDDIRNNLLAYMQNPKASSCSDVALMLALNKYNVIKSRLVNELKMNDVFSIVGDARRFRIEEKLRKNYLCSLVGSKSKFRISPIAEVAEVYAESNL